jgi:hypothetical protein
MTQLVDPLVQETGDPGKVKVKKNSAKNLKAGAVRKHKKRAAGIAAGSAEVMVKISSYGKGGGHVKAHLMYISRHSNADAEKIALENDKGQLFDSVDDVKELYEHWSAEIDANKRAGKDNQRDTMHMVLSMPGKADPLAMRRAVRDFAADNFGGNHEYVFALHADTDNDHCHLVVKCRGFDGKQLRTTPEKLQHWRESFAERLRERGIDAEATPRQVRGVVRRAEKQVFRHMDPQRSHVLQARAQEAREALQAEAEGRQIDASPWERDVKTWQGKTKAEWLRLVQDLRTQPTALKTKDGKELSNEPINYSRAAAVAGYPRAFNRGRSGSPSANTRESSNSKLGTRGAPIAVPGLRDVPHGHVVRDQGGAAVFLRANSRRRLDTGGPADHEVRRTRAGVASDAGRQRLSKAESNRILAEQIEAFVARMPEPVTAREVAKRKLRADRQAGQDVQSITPGRQVERDIHKGKDNGRNR